MRLKSLYAGISIALGCILYILIDNKIVGALCFSAGLLNVRYNKLLLATGQAQYLPTKERTYADWFKILFYNCIGALFMAGLFYLCFNGDDAFIKVNNIGTLKANNNFLNTSLKAFLCGIIMSIATKKESSYLLSSLCVFAFVQAGLNHCIADCFYLIFGDLSWNTLITFLIIVFGNLLGGMFIVLPNKRED